MPNSILDAIKQGLWDYEPGYEPRPDRFSSTVAMPGTAEKLEVLAERVRLGLPLWHPSDCCVYDDLERMRRQGAPAQ